jgi:hypothetical protein
MLFVSAPPVRQTMENVDGDGDMFVVQIPVAQVLRNTISLALLR